MKKNGMHTKLSQENNWKQTTIVTQKIWDISLLFLTVYAAENSMFKNQLY